MLDTTGCINNTIKVASGHYLDLADPDPNDIDVHSIASALSKICRFGGHCPEFYSVAEHCVHAVGLAAADNCSNDVLRCILLHDASEAFLGDCVKPLKIMLPDYAVVEQRMEDTIAKRFDLDMQHNHDTVKFYDRLMLKAEKIAIWPKDRAQWAGFASIPARPVNFGFMEPRAAFEHFMGMASALGIK